MTSKYLFRKFSFPMEISIPPIVSVVADVTPAIGIVTCRDTSSRGTAFVIHKDGFLVSANHVVSRIELRSGAVVSNYSSDIVVLLNGINYKATIVNDQSELAPLVYDYVILKINATTPLSAIDIQDYSTVRQGDEVICAGFPLDFNSLVVSKGVVSALVRHQSIFNSLQNVDSIVTDALMQFGSSGGPLILASTGNVIGINTRKHNQTDELEFLLRQASTLPNDNIMRRIIELMAKYRHLGLHHANAIHYVTQDPAYPV